MALKTALLNDLERLTNEANDLRAVLSRSRAAWEVEVRDLRIELMVVRHALQERDQTIAMLHHQMARMAQPLANEHEGGGCRPETDLQGGLGALDA